MNQPASVSEALQRLSKAAAEFTGPPGRARSQEALMPFAGIIKELREKQASYALIAEMLAAERICVSRYVVARFCRERLEIEPAAPAGKRKQRRGPYGRRASAAAGPSNPSAAHSAPESQPARDLAPSQTAGAPLRAPGAISAPAALQASGERPRIRGPRIADVANL